MSPTISRRIVDFPDPEGPTRAVVAPPGIERVVGWSATVSPNRFSTPTSSTLSGIDRQRLARTRGGPARRHREAVPTQTIMTVVTEAQGAEL
jgi:hypothetical protein